MKVEEFRRHRSIGAHAIRLGSRCCCGGQERSYMVPGAWSDGSRPKAVLPNFR
jgi:hypothetical protein